MFGSRATIAPYVHRQSGPVTVHRRDDTTSGQWGDSVGYTKLNNERQLFVVGFEEVRQATDAGDQQSKSLTAYSTTGVDLQVNDRIEYGTDADGNAQLYEVTAKVGLPDDVDPMVYEYELEDV